MTKKPSPDADQITDNASEVAALRAMSREDRLRALMKSLDAVCGPSPSRGRSAPPRKAPVHKPGKSR